MILVFLETPTVHAWRSKDIFKWIPVCGIVRKAFYRNKKIQATMNLLVSGPKCDMALGAESRSVPQQLLSLCRACSKGKNFDSYCQINPKSILRPLKSMLGGEF